MCNTKKHLKFEAAQQEKVIKQNKNPNKKQTKNAASQLSLENVSVSRIRFLLKKN